MKDKVAKRKHLTADQVATVMWEALALKLMMTGNATLPGSLKDQPDEVIADFLTIGQKEADRWNSK